MLELNKIYCGDCLVVMKQIDDKKIDMILCDLPYGTTTCKWDTVIPFEPLWLQYERIIKDNGTIVLTASQPFTTDLINSNRKWFKYEMVYKKRAVNHLLSKIRPMQAHENILIFCNGNELYNPQMIKRTKEELSRLGKMNCLDGRKIKTERGFKIVETKADNYDYKYPNTVINVILDQLQKIQHPTQKPVALFEYLIKTYTNEGDLVLDNCIGSGTTAIACLNNNRNFIGMDIEQKYVEIANKRINDFKYQLQMEMV